MLAATCVAPSSRERSRLCSTGSTATTYRQPAARAPCTAFAPMPPIPMTTAVSPARRSAVRTEEPKPVVTPQPTSAARSSGKPSSIFTADFTGTTVCRANVPSRHIWPRSSPRAWNR